MSASAVSRSFTPGASASSAVRARVLKAAKELNYRPNVMARSIITRRSHLAAIIMATDTNLQYPEVLAELSRALARRSLRVMLFTLDAMSELDATVDQVWSYQADGVLALLRLRDEQIAQLEEHGHPVVLFNRAPEQRPVSSVSCDHEAAGRLLGQAVRAAGHRRIALIHGPAASSVSVERMRGVLEALHGVPGATLVEARGDYSYGSGASAMASLYADRRFACTAVIAASDMMALGALDHARHRLGLRVPQELSFAGFDGVSASGWESFRLTTVRQPIRAMSDAAADLLVARVEDPARIGERRVFAGELVRGESLAPPAPAGSHRRASKAAGGASD